MVVFLLVFVVIAVSVGLLAVGVLSGRGPLTGTCGSATCPKALTCAGCRKPNPEEAP